MQTVQGLRWGLVRADWLDNPDVGADEIAVLAVLSTYAGRDGTCWPSQSTLAGRLKRSRPWVISVLNELERLGLVRRERRHAKGGAMRSCLYEIVGHGDTLAAMRPDTGDTVPASALAPDKVEVCQPADTGVKPADREHLKPINTGLSQRGGQEPVMDGGKDLGCGFPKTLPPLDWRPSAADLAFAAEQAPLVDPLRFAARYVSCCHAHGYRYRDHSAAYRTWLLNAWEKPDADRTRHDRPHPSHVVHPVRGGAAHPANGDTARAALALLTG
jgi:Helix-turn-helix domain